MTDEEIRGLVAPDFQPSDEEVAWLRAIIEVELSRRPGTMGREEAALFLAQGIRSRSDPEAAKALRERGLPALGDDLTRLTPVDKLASDPVLEQLITAEAQGLEQLLAEMAWEPPTPELPSDFGSLFGESGSPLDRCKAAYREMTAEQRQQFVRWMMHPEEEKPGRGKRKPKGNK